MAAQIQRQILEFGPFHLHLDEGRLLREGRVVPLPPKALDTLSVLARAAGRLVTKEELLAEIWKEAFVEEGSLTYSISVLRKALGETASERLIETIPRRGYRMAVPVRQVEQPGRRGDEHLATTAASLRTRLRVTPFRTPKPDNETDFLAFSLPEAVAGALSALQSLSVQWIATPRPGAAEPAADVELAGTIVRIGDRIRVSVQLLEAVGTTVMWSHRWQVPIGDLLVLQDELTHRITESIAAPLSVHEEQSLRRRAPATPRAFEYYLRGNQLAYEASQWESAIALYQRALAEDPQFAPAWARLARCQRLVAKFARNSALARDHYAQAEDAFARALRLDPSLTLAQSLYAQLEVDLGRAEDALRRLVRLAREVPDDPHMFAALVHACRFCGLLEESLAAHDRARQLDPQVPTSVSHTRWQLGDFPGALDETFGDIGYMPGLALLSLGRREEALAALRWRERETTDNRIRAYLASLRALIEEQRSESLAAADRARSDLRDAEALFYLVRTYAYWGERDRAIAGSAEVAEQGFFCAHALASDPWFASVRGDAAFGRLQRQLDARVTAAREAFRELGGDRLLRGGAS